MKKIWKTFSKEVKKRIKSLKKKLTIVELLVMIAILGIAGFLVIKVPVWYSDTFDLTEKGSFHFKKDEVYRYERGKPIFFYGKTVEDFKAIFTYWKEANPNLHWKVRYDSRGIAERYDVTDDGTGGVVCFKADRECDFVLK